MSTSNGGHFPMNLPILDGKNWERWNVQMKVLFDAHKFTEIVMGGYEELGANPTEAQRTTYNNAKKKDCKALWYIHQCVDASNFEKIATASTSKAAWDALVKCYTGGTKVKKVRLQSLRRQYELMHMESTEKVTEYLTRLVTLTNQMKSCGETISDQLLIEKVMRTLTPQFDFIVVAIEESKEVSEMTIEELQGSLEAHELRIVDRGVVIP